MTGEALARAALGLAGVPFRLHGRDPARGLDCIGVLEAAASACGHGVRLPNGYALRSRRLPGLERIAASLLLHPASGAVTAGDVLLLRPGACQHHLVIALGAGRIVHAHAGLRKVVIGALPMEWPVVRHWRPFPEGEGPGGSDPINLALI